MSTTAYSSPILSSFPLDALTTTFTPPATCSGVFTSSGVAIIDPDLSCLPEGFKKSSTDYFSPGLVCPSGYVTACNDNAGVSSITTVTCCPYREDITLGCVTPSTLSSVWETLFCTWIAPESGAEVQITVSNGGTTSTQKTTMTSPGGINAYGVRMVYESSDLAAATATSGQSTPASGASATATNTSTGSVDADSGGNSGLSIGATIAIAIVVPLVVIGAAVWIFFFIRKRKQAQRLHPRGGASSMPGFGDQKGHYGTVGSAPAGYTDPKIPGLGLAEVSGVGAYGVRNQHQEAVELGEREPPVELPAEHYR
ncbi:hypothetical protein SLS53_006147 [Cytospora paraplurivora]|uniref:Mid2 domain-containing protein n=1 Tax=Cytospora paraplurivora TaxID=2898453 RepID=A0AAN9U451_9PEZI